MRATQRQVSRWRVRRARRALAVADGWTRDDLVAAAAALRGRPILVTEGEPEDGDTCGAWIQAETEDRIVLVGDAPAWHQDAILAHEIAHMALNHVPSGTDSLATSLSSLVPDIDPADIVSALARTRYDTPDEMEAEWLATALFARSATASQQREHIGAYHRSIRTALGGV